MIEINGVYKTFDDRHVLTNVTLTLKKGQIFGLIGKNGAGKTTLLSIIAGLIDASKGSVIIGNHLVSKRTPYRSIGYLPDVPSFWDHLTANEYIHFLGKDHRRSSDDSQYFLDLVKVNPQTKINSMSRGTRQRLGLAAVLVNDPDVVLLDEPTSALDPEGRQDFMDILTELKKQDKIIILSSHILTDMERLCDIVGFLHQGSIVRILTSSELSSAQSIELVFREALPCDTFNIFTNSVELTSKNTLLVSIETLSLEEQKQLFGKLALLDNPVVQMNSNKVSLDRIFKEICQ